MRRQLIVLFAILLMTFAFGAFAQTAAEPYVQSDLESFRADLLTYVTSLSKLPPQLTTRFGADSASLERAEASIRAMSPEDLSALKTQMDRVPYWKQMPQILGEAVRQAMPQAVPSPRELGMQLGVAGQFEEAESIRKALLGMVRSLRQIPAERVRPGYQQRVDRLEQMILGATQIELLESTATLKAHSDKWSLNLSRAMSSDPAIRSMAASTEAFESCGNAFPSAIICGINELINDVVTFFQNLPTYATDAFNSVKNFILDFGNNLPSTLSALANKIGLNNINWNQVANTALTYVRLPCPPAGFNLPGFGTVGEIRTWKNFAGTVGFAGNAIKDVTPSDVLTSLDLQAVMIVANFPIQWLSRCLENSWDSALQDAETAHQGLVHTNLDVVASTRASQTSVDTAQTQTNSTTADVAKVEGKLDRLGALDDAIESTTKNTIVTSDRLETTSIRLDKTSLRLESKIDNLQLQQGQTNTSLDTLKSLWLRMSIEANLTDDEESPLSLFQLPASVGGYLELVRSIVQETLQKRASAGIKVTNATKYFNDGTVKHQAGDFKNAYRLFRKAYQKSVSGNDEGNN
jgi:hypothetical protein